MKYNGGVISEVEAEQTNTQFTCNLIAMVY